MVYISGVVARTPGTTDIRAVDRAESILNPEQLNLRGRVERAALKNGKEGYLVVSLQYDTPVTLDFVNQEFGRILAATAHRGLPIDLFTHPTKIVKLSDSLYPNPMLVERVPLYDDFSTPVPEGQSLYKKLGYAVVIRVPNYFPKDIWESLAGAVKGTGHVDVEKLGEGFKWFHEAHEKRALVIPQRRQIEIGEYPVDFLDIRIEGHVREDQRPRRGGRYDLIEEINEYFEGFKTWLQGTTPAPERESRNSVDRFLRDPNSREFRVWLEQQKREQEGVGREEVKAGTLKPIGEYLDIFADINVMNSALTKTPPGGQLRPLLPHVIFKGLLFEEERPERRVQHGTPNRIVTFYRVRYDGRFLTTEQRNEAFSPDGANFTPSIEENSSIVL